MNGTDALLCWIIQGGGDLGQMDFSKVADGSLTMSRIGTLSLDIVTGHQKVIWRVQMTSSNQRPPAIFVLFYFGDSS